MRTRSQSSKSPAFAMGTFSPVVSSAGVPITLIWAGIFSFSSTCLRALAARTEIAPHILWPQPCPTSGKASYWARSPTVGASSPLFLKNALKPVSYPAYGRSIVKFSFSRASHKTLDVSYSSWLSSGCSAIQSLSVPSSSRFLQIYSSIFSARSSY